MARERLKGILNEYETQQLVDEIRLSRLSAYSLSRKSKINDAAIRFWLKGKTRPTRDAAFRVYKALDEFYQTPGYARSLARR